MIRMRFSLVRAILGPVLQTLVLAGAMLLCQRLSAAVTFTVTPAAVSNHYAGAITLQASGLLSGETVLVEKFLDANANGVVDTGDVLVQSFRVTDGQLSVIGGVTNLNVPGDQDPTPGALSVPLNLANSSLSQQIVGQYAFRLSSPASRFTPLTNLFKITESAYLQSFSGTVLSGGSPVPYAGVLLFTPPSGDGGGGVRPLAGTLANNAGVYSLKAPPGTYLLMAAKNNYVTDLMASPVLSLGPGNSMTANLTLQPASRTVAGKLVDAANASFGLAGVQVIFESEHGLFAYSYSDSSGNFSVAVTPGQWRLGWDNKDFDLLGYLMLSDHPGVDTSSANVTGLTVAFPKGTALIYGSITDAQGRAMPGATFGDANNGPLSADATSDQSGKYYMAVTAGAWQGDIDAIHSGYSNYVFSAGLRGFAVTDGAARQFNLVALLATNQISGYLKNGQGNPLAGVALGAVATINSLIYQNYDGLTDGQGHYVLWVANGSWTVTVDYQGGDHSLVNLGNYQNPASQTVVIANNNAVVNFTAVAPGSLQIATTSLPNGTLNSFYSAPLSASGGQSPYNWSLARGSANLPANLTLGANGVLSGIPATNGTFNFIVMVTDAAGATASQAVFLTIPGAPLQVTTTALPAGTVGANYRTQLQAADGQPPYRWSLALGSANLPLGLSLASDGFLTGAPATSGTFAFITEVTDAANAKVDQPWSLTINNAPLPPSLKFARAGRNLVLFWPTNFTLQSTTKLSVSNTWSPVSAVPGVSNALNTLTIDASTGNQFFRLSR